jgi:regulator of RNase E activity RraB
MDIDFQVAAPDESTARRVAEEASQLGYRVRILHDDAEEDADEEGCLPWTCDCTRTMLPDHGAIVAAQAELDHIARPLGACVDGWGTFGNVEPGEPKGPPDHNGS